MTAAERGFRFARFADEFLTDFRLLTDDFREREFEDAIGFVVTPVRGAAFKAFGEN
ncbi:MAG: hypothetical protein Tsb009_01890 [Planctomycetaceae bacterium]